MSPHCVLSSALVEVVSAEFHVFDVVALDVVRDFEDLVRDGHGRLLVPGVSHDAAIARLEGRVLGPGDGERAFHQGMAQVRVPLRRRPDRRLPALSFCPGQRPAQLHRFPALGN